MWKKSGKNAAREELTAAYNEYVRCLKNYCGDDDQFEDSFAMDAVINRLASLAELQHIISWTCIYNQPGGEQLTHEFHNDDYDVKVSISEMHELWTQMRSQMIIDFQNFIEAHNKTE